MVATLRDRIEEEEEKRRREGRRGGGGAEGTEKDKEKGAGQGAGMKGCGIGDCAGADGEGVVGRAMGQAHTIGQRLGGLWDAPWGVTTDLTAGDYLDCTRWRLESMGFD